MAEIKFVGFDDIDMDAFQRSQIESLVAKHADRIQRMIDNELELVVHLKEYAQQGEKHKFSVHIRATYPGGTIVSDKVHDWELRRAVQHGLVAVEEQLQKKFRI